MWPLSRPPPPSLGHPFCHHLSKFSDIHDLSLALESVQFFVPCHVFEFFMDFLPVLSHNIRLSASLSQPPCGVVDGERMVEFDRTCLGACVWVLRERVQRVVS